MVSDEKGEEEKAEDGDDDHQDDMAARYRI